MTVPNDGALAEMVQAFRVVHAANLTLDPWGFVAIRDSSGRGIRVTNDAVGFNEVEVGDLVLVRFLATLLLDSQNLTVRAPWRSR
jgi:hypothetical protein